MNIDVARSGAWWKRQAVRSVVRARTVMAWVLGSAALLGATRTVAAQPAAHLSLTWDAPVGCPGRDDIHSRVDALLGGDASASSVADVQASGRVERVATGFRLELSLAASDRPTVREFQAGTCDELAGAAAIAIALLARSAGKSVDSTASTSARPASPATPEPGAKARESQAPPTPASKPQNEPSNDDEARSSRLHVLIDAPLGVVNWGSLPSIGLGVGAAAGVRWRALRVVVGGELWRAQTLEESGFVMQFSLQSARLDACLTKDVSGVEIGPCAGVALDRLTGRGVASEIYSAESSRTFWVSGTGGIMAAVPIPGFSALRILGQASVRVATRRPRFVIDQFGPVHQPAMAAPKLDFGCGWIF